MVAGPDGAVAPTGARAIDFPIRSRGFGFDDFTVGRSFEHEQRRTVLESDNALFTTWSLALHPRYLDREHNLANGERDILVNPMLVFATVFGLSVEDLSEKSVAFLGIDELRFGVPVHPGDTLRATSAVTASRTSATRPAGIVSWRTTGFNQRDETVITFLRSNMFSLKEGR